MASKGDKSPESLLASLNLPTITEDQNKVLVANSDYRRTPKGNL